MEDQMIGVRHERNRLLSLCDWTQVADAPLSAEQKTAWAAYRQHLRDLPENCSTPAEVVWPMHPE